MFRIMLPPAVAGLPNQDTCTRPRTTQEKKERQRGNRSERKGDKDREGRKERGKKKSKQTKMRSDHG